VGRAVRLHELRTQLRSQVITPRSSSALPMLIDALFETPAMTITRARTLLGVTHRAATVTVERLVAAGVLAEVAPRGRARMFVAPGILAAGGGRDEDRDRP